MTETLQGPSVCTENGMKKLKKKKMLGIFGGVVMMLTALKTYPLSADRPAII